MNAYPWLKHLHVTLAVVSVSGFALRGVWMALDSPWLSRRWVRIAPHLVDTGLLLSGASMAFALGISPLEHAWLGAKLVALVGYVALGVMALRPGRPRPVRLAALTGALLVATYIIATALSHNPAPWRWGA